MKKHFLLRPFYLAFNQLLPDGWKGLCFRWIRRIGTCGVILGVMFVIVFQCVKGGGFGAEIKRLVIASGLPLMPEAVMQEKLNYAQRGMMLQWGGAVLPDIKESDVGPEDQVVPFNRYRVERDLHILDKEVPLIKPQLTQLMASIGPILGSLISVYSPIELEKSDNNVSLLPKELQRVRFFKAGWTQLNGKTVEVSLEKMQSFYDDEAGVLLLFSLSF